MSELKDISEKINLETTKEYVQVTLEANQYQLEKLEQFQQFLKSTRGFLSGKIVQATEEALVIQYSKNPYTQSIGQVIKKMDKYERLLLAQKVHYLVEFLGTPVQPFIHPENIFIFGEEMLIAHRGFMHSIVPYSADEKEFFKQYRALILAILHPKYEYEQLIQGSGTLKDALSKQLQEAKTINEMEQIIGEQVIRQKAKREAETKLVSKKSYLSFKWASVVLFVLTLIFATTTGIYVLKKLPAQERVSIAEAQYIANDYASVMKTLKEDSPEELPTGAKYVAAVSSVQLDNLSNEQKTAILNNLSQKSSENALLYWIYIGKGNFKKSLDIAQNLGDNQYILHAYTKLYDATKANNKMNGEKKQELLTKYEEAINKYMKVLGGKKDDNKDQ
ncbi:type VII secretion protein EssB [Enterococcus faecalis]|nr:type VII secretion protein EssB [Enterococcus faecalis]EKQ3613485.1 type VII secretion protein EssB [Enterococcus faecalis]